MNDSNKSISYESKILIQKTSNSKFLKNEEMMSDIIVSKSVLT